MSRRSLAPATRSVVAGNSRAARCQLPEMGRAATSILKIWRRKSGVSPMADASQSFHFFGRLSSYESPALVMFMHLLASRPWRRPLARCRPHTGQQCGGGHHDTSAAVASTSVLPASARASTAAATSRTGGSADRLGTTDVHRYWPACCIQNRTPERRLDR